MSGIFGVSTDSAFSIRPNCLGHHEQPTIRRTEYRPRASATSRIAGRKTSGSPSSRHAVRYCAAAGCFSDSSSRSLYDSAFAIEIRGHSAPNRSRYCSKAFLNPREVVLALASACRQLGVSIVQVCAVRSARVGRGSVSLETGDGAYRHRALVVAAGGWSDSIDLAAVPDTPRSEEH